jgi:chorismate--pyruvate lyase
VRVLRQGFGLPTADEARLLGIEPGVWAWVREVALHCDEQRVVFAHTVLPYRPRGPLQLWLERLGNRSLGALLFSHPGFRRGKINYKRLDERHTLFASALGALQLEEVEAGRLWARRSHFRFGAQSVLVTEVFSPRMLQLRETNKKKHAQRADAIMCGCTERPMAARCDEHREPGRNSQAPLPSGVDSFSAALAQSFCADSC